MQMRSSLDSVLDAGAPFALLQECMSWRNTTTSGLGCLCNYHRSPANSPTRTHLLLACRNHPIGALLRLLLASFYAASSSDGIF
jgi:hypothetical protein